MLFYFLNKPKKTINTKKAETEAIVKAAGKK